MRANSIKGMWLCSVVIICFSFAVIPGSVSALPYPYAEGSFGIDWSTATIDVTPGTPAIAPLDGIHKGYEMNGSYIKAKVESDPDGSEKLKVEKKVQKKIYEENTANVNIGTTRAFTSTNYDSLAGSLAGPVYAEGNLGIKRKAQSFAEQWMYFKVEEDFTLELTVDYFLKQGIDAQATDEWAKAKTNVYFELGALDFEFDVKKNKEKAIWDWIADEDEMDWKKTPGVFSDSDGKSGTLTLSYDYEIGDLGYLWLYGKSKVEAKKASPVPEPATMFLLGSGLICLAGVRRKFRAK